ncbi:MAG: DNA cytosine methyltransferase [Pyrinomonadaceae bacterium]
MTNYSDKPFTTWDVVDFFSGCGGMSYGFHTVGEQTGQFRMVAAFDNDRHANATYRRNLGIQPFATDIANAEINEIERLMVLGGRKKQNPLIVIGCAPCQGFSSHRKKDPRKDGRNSLVGKFGEIAVGLRPDAIIMENVPDLLARKHWSHYQNFLNILNDNGYKISSGILNFAEFGVPQERHRAVVIAAKGFQPSMPSGFLGRDAFRTVRDAIGSLPPLKAGETSVVDVMHQTSNHRPSTLEIIRTVPKNGGSRPAGVGPACLDRVKGFYDVYGRLRWDRPAVTITARCRTPSCGRFVHPEQDRGLSVREAGLLQGFPSDFEFEGPFDDKFKQVGNAVSPIFSKRLAGHVLEILSGKGRTVEQTKQTLERPTFKSYSGSIARLKLKDPDKVELIAE